MTTHLFQFDNETFTNDELYKKLGFFNTPTDRELEAKLIFYINKFSATGDNYKPTLYDFFNQVYDYFFENTADNLDLGGDGGSSFLGGSGGGFDVSANVVSVMGDGGKAVPNIPVINTVAYSRDVMNPILKQTTQRIISIDSKYRNNVNFKNNISTDFTVELSEPLKDVLSLKLYSYQIPYTWYTVSRDFGSNFFILKGISAGLIDNGSYDFKVDISAGNYTPVELTAAINTKFTQLSTIYTDISFGTTQLKYNPITTNASFVLDIQNKYNEQQYYLDWGNVSGDASIKNYLGFSENVASINTIYSSRNSIPSIAITERADADNSIFYNVDTPDYSNNYFKVVHYVNPVVLDNYSNAYIDNYVAGISTVLETIIVYSSLPTGKYTRNRMQTDFLNQLITSPYFETAGSTFERIDRTDISYSYYKLSVPYNRKTTIANELNSKIAIVFPDEPADKLLNGTFPLWTGSQSCFQFDASFVECNTILSTLALPSSNYLFQTANVPEIRMSCNVAGYDNSLNNVLIRVALPPDSTIGYNIDEYLSAINTGISTATGLGVFNTSSLGGTSGLIIDASLNAELVLDYSLIFNNKDYLLDFTGSLQLNDIRLFNGSAIDLSFNSVFTNTTSIPIVANYTILIDVSGNATQPLFILSPKTGHGNENAGVFRVPFLNRRGVQNGSSYSYDSYLKILNDYNDSLHFFMDGFGGLILGGSNLSVASVNGLYVFSLQMNVLKNLSQRDFHLYLYDASGNGTDFGATCSWTTYLNFDPLVSYYDLSLTDGTNYIQQIPPNTIIYSQSKIFGKEPLQIIAGVNDLFYFRPNVYADGLYTTIVNDTVFPITKYNDIRIKLPAGNYTAIELFNTLNAIFTANPITRGSSFQLVHFNGEDYVQLRMNINKIFNANDYILYFYDPVSFVNCYVGSTSVRNTTWDTTLGWILGFQEQTSYYLRDYTNEAAGVGTGRGIIALITGEKSVNVNLYSYFLITLDDYNQNRLNDGLVTISKSQTNLPLPSYASIANFSCDVNGNTITTGSTEIDRNNLTLNQVYAINQIFSSQQASSKIYSQGPYIKDIFGIIPIKTSGLQNGQLLTEFGGSLQNQERMYFGPVNIKRLQIQLYNDQGNIMDLNGANWSFSFLCEQLYQKGQI